jgi:hypothetical protein
MKHTSCANFRREKVQQEPDERTLTLQYPAVHRTSRHVEAMMLESKNMLNRRLKPQTPRGPPTRPEAPLMPAGPYEADGQKRIPHESG